MNLPSWLPGLFPVSPWTSETYNELYLLFKMDFINSKPIYRGQVVWCFLDKDDGKEKIFWHLTSREDEKTKERLPDFRRSERLPWVHPTIDQSERSEILAWDYKEGDGTTRTYVWLENDDFVVIMKKYPDGRRRLITSFWVEYENTKRKLRLKYDRRL